MQMDVKDLRDFYDSPLGVTVRRLLRQRIRERWTRVHGEVVIGLGFAIPYLSPFRGEAAVLGAFMPAAQGVIAWPPDGPRQSVLVEEGALPLPDSSVDRLLMVHSLELSEQVRPLLREVWRVLKPEGRLLLIVPNRRGPWARFDTTPFGHGRPYSRGQLEGLLLNAMLARSVGARRCPCRLSIGGSCGVMPIRSSARARATGRRSPGSIWSKRAKSWWRPWRCRGGWSGRGSCVHSVRRPSCRRRRDGMKRPASRV